MPEVLNAHITGREPGENQVYIGRPSKWGNPFKLGTRLAMSRADVVVKYQHYLFESGLYKDLEELRGKDLICWCAPQQCHGDVLVFLANIDPEVLRKAQEKSLLETEDETDGV